MYTKLNFILERLTGEMVNFVCIRHLKPDGSFVPFKMLQNKHNIPDNDYLSYLGLITTIPRIWKVLIKDDNVLV